VTRWQVYSWRCDSTDEDVWPADATEFKSLGQPCKRFQLSCWTGPGLTSILQVSCTTWLLFKVGPSMPSNQTTMRSYPPPPAHFSITLCASYFPQVYNFSIIYDRNLLQPQCQRWECEKVQWLLPLHYLPTMQRHGIGAQSSQKRLKTKRYILDIWRLLRENMFVCLAFDGLCCLWTATHPGLSIRWSTLVKRPLGFSLDCFLSGRNSCESTHC